MMTDYEEPTFDLLDVDPEEVLEIYSEANQELQQLLLSFVGELDSIVKAYKIALEQGMLEGLQNLLTTMVEFRYGIEALAIASLEPEAQELLVCDSDTTRQKVFRQVKAKYEIVGIELQHFEAFPTIPINPIQFQLLLSNLLLYLCSAEKSKEPRRVVKVQFFYGIGQQVLHIQDNFINYKERGVEEEITAPEICTQQERIQLFGYNFEAFYQTIRRNGLTLSISLLGKFNSYMITFKERSYGSSL